MKVSPRQMLACIPAVLRYTCAALRAGIPGKVSRGLCRVVSWLVVRYSLSPVNYTQFVPTPEMIR
jgi:hypothetical protein